MRTADALCARASASRTSLTDTRAHVASLAKAAAACKGCRRARGMPRLRGARRCRLWASALPLTTHARPKPPRRLKPARERWTPPRAAASLTSASATTAAALAARSPPPPPR
ncbi:hypothetical protein PR202_gb27516 [Eleusine coracana subsp. coracana]|uniref:Uncharacterized protein n=1 Tax=Eleusine coracana subsp. coracana TaxID=191504 RepID=A0AAV5FRW3_ELECO|nr:hypothetical protein PR202_gb27516 [Eleusine coracana subsp. coracana]